MPSSPPLHLTDLLGPALGAVVFVLAMSLVREPARRSYNALLVAGASGVYFSGGLGLWEFAYAAVACGVVAFLGLRSYRFIGLGWLMHAGWDLVHHLYGNPIWPQMPTSSFGCLIFDTLIALWFLADAPSVLPLAVSTLAGRRRGGSGPRAPSGGTMRP
jgi:Family of unknown function (DUF6010)